LGSNSTGKLAGLAAAVGAAALLIVQGAQAAIGPFDPRWEAQVLLTAGVVCLTLLTQRLASRHRDAAAKRQRAVLLEQSVREWPLRTANEADPQALGVFPPARDVNGDAYVERQIDGDLEAAISASTPLLLVGAPLAGKSRTALQAVRRARGDARMVAPCNAYALRQLLALDPKLAFDMAERILWLDGLGRYVKALDARVLDGLAEGGVPIVATAREKTWTRMLASEAADGEAAKALAARARTFELPLTPSQKEQGDATELLGRRDYSRGLGPALSSKGTEARAPVRSAGATSPEAVVDGSTPAPTRRGWRQLDPLLAGVAAGCLLCFGWVGYYVATGAFKKPTTPSIADQVEDAKAAGELGNRRVIARARGDFHGSGRQSYFFAFGDENDTPPAEARSDEIQVWDVHGKKLDRAFAFEPRLLGDEQTVFQYRNVGDIDGDGADELVGGYGTEAIRGELLVPFALDWDSDTRTYQLVSLTPEPPRFATRARDRDSRGLRDTYRKRLALTDRLAHGKPLELAGYPAQDFSVSESDQLLINAYVADIRPKRSQRLMELQPQLFHRTGGPPEMSPCTLQGTDTLTGGLPQADIRLLEGALHDFWRLVSKGRYCAASD
jgi:hypothetical protein